MNAQSNTLYKVFESYAFEIIAKSPRGQWVKMTLPSERRFMGGDIDYLTGQANVLCRLSLVRHIFQEMLNHWQLDPREYTQVKFYALVLKYAYHWWFKW